MDEAAQRARLMAIGARLQELRSCMRLARRQARVTPTRVLSAAQTRVARSLVAIQNGEPAALLAWLTGCLDSPEARSECVVAAVSWYSAAPPNMRVRFCTDPESAQEKHAVRTAARYLREQRLRDFVERANLMHGIAPVSAVLLSEMGRWQADEVWPTSPTQPGTTRKAQRQWLQRWRGRWNVVQGRIPPREAMPVEERCAKAPCIIWYIMVFDRDVPYFPVISVPETRSAFGRSHDLGVPHCDPFLWVACGFSVHRGSPKMPPLFL